MQPLKKRSTFEEVAGLLGTFHITPPDRKATELINSPAIQQFLSLSRDLQDQEDNVQADQEEVPVDQVVHHTVDSTAGAALHTGGCTAPAAASS